MNAFVPKNVDSKLGTSPAKIKQNKNEQTKNKDTKQIVDPKYPWESL